MSQTRGVPSCRARGAETRTTCMRRMAAAAVTEALTAPARPGHGPGIGLGHRLQPELRAGEGRADAGLQEGVAGRPHRRRGRIASIPPRCIFGALDHPGDVAVLRAELPVRPRRRRAHPAAVLEPRRHRGPQGRRAAVRGRCSRTTAASLVLERRTRRARSSTAPRCATSTSARSPAASWSSPPSYGSSPATAAGRRCSEISYLTTTSPGTRSTWPWSERRRHAASADRLGLDRQPVGRDLQRRPPEAGGGRREPGERPRRPRFR